MLAPAMDDATALHCLIEIPKGSRNKYEWDAGPAGDQAQPLPVLLGRLSDRLRLHHRHARPARRRARRAGVRLRADLPRLPDRGARRRRPAHGRRGGPQRQARVRPADDPAWDEVEGLEALSSQLRSEIQHFYSMYKQPEGKDVDIHGWDDRDAAAKAIEQAASTTRRQARSVGPAAVRARHREVVRRPRGAVRARPRARRRGAHRRARPERRRQVDAAAHPRGDEHPDAGTVTSRRGLVLASLPQIVEGDDRAGLATVLDARPELTALERELAQAEQRPRRPGAGRRHAQDRARARQPGAAARRWGELGGERAADEARTHLTALGLDDDALSRPTRELSGGQRKLVALAACLARRPGPAAARRARGAPRHEPPRRARAADRRLRRRRADGLPRPPPARRVRRHDRRARPRQASASGRAPTRPTPSRAGSSSSASSSSS